MGDRRERMRVNRALTRDHINAIVFFGVQNDEWKGTGFFLEMLCDGVRVRYLVTNEHTVRELERSDSGGFVRYRSGEETAVVEFHESALHGPWHVGTERIDGGDLAVAAFYPELTHLPTAIRYEDLASKAMIDHWGIQPGDETRTIGLYERRAGDSEISPLVRMGIISAMQDDDYHPDKAPDLVFKPYLIETRSMGGMSGSPVFVLIDASFEGDGRPSDLRHRHALLIGVNSGGWTQKVDTVNKLLQVSEGISVAVPATYLTRLLESEPVVHERRLFVERVKQDVESVGG